MGLNLRHLFHIRHKDFLRILLVLRDAFRAVVCRYFLTIPLVKFKIFHSKISKIFRTFKKDYQILFGVVTKIFSTWKGIGHKKFLEPLSHNTEINSVLYHFFESQHPWRVTNLLWNQLKNILLPFPWFTLFFVLEMLVHPPRSFDVTWH